MICRMERSANGILIIDKPEGFTSFDVCAKLRRLLRQRRIGHSGTLDPMATGVMVLLLGAATRAAELLPDHDKRYTAGFRLGMTTDTLDITGTVQSRTEANIDRVSLEQCLKGFVGEISQIPPMYSAVHEGGRRLYELAREGRTVERAARRVAVRQLDLLDYDGRAEGAIDVVCSKGTYIRTLIDDIGRELGCGGVMTSLRRTVACGFSLSDSITIEKAVELSEAGELFDRITPVDRAFALYPECRVTQKQAERYMNGGGLFLERVTISQNAADGSCVRVYGPDGFIGLGVVSVGDELLKPFKKLC